jgi:hypothetical protein
MVSQQQPKLCQALIQLKPRWGEYGPLHGLWFRYGTLVLIPLLA